MMQLLEYFLSQNYAVTFATTAAFSPHMEDLNTMGISTARIDLNNSSFDVFLEELQPEIVVFDRFMMEEQFSWRVDAVCPGALKVLNTEDLHFLRDFREKQCKNKNNPPCFPGASQLAKREIASIYRCDLSLIISEFEMQFLKDQFAIPEELLLYLPFLLEKITPENISGLPGFEHREHFISIGNFRHAPNTDSVIYLKQEVWPLIKSRLPKAEMHIYGAYPSAKITQLHAAKDNFLIKGWAKNSQDVVKTAKICLSPLRFGAGLKGKLIEAMQCGTPSVTTPIGAEGIPGDLPWNGAIEDDPEGLANAAVNLYTSEKKWQEAQQKGFEIINARFSKTYFYPVLTHSILKIKADLSIYRQRNFTGAMLMHHRVKSTYFLSKYIEVKNELERIKEIKKPPQLS